MSAIATRVSPPPLPDARHRPGSSLRSGLTTGTVLVLVGFPLLLTAVTIPKFVEIFRDFGAALPELSLAFIALGRALATPLGAVGGLLFLAVLFAIVAPVAYRWRRGAIVACVLAIAFFVVYLALYFLAMQLPLAAMVKSLQQGGAV